MASQPYQDMCAELIGTLHIQLKESELEVKRLTKIVQDYKDREILINPSNPIDVQQEINLLKSKGIL